MNFKISPYNLTFFDLDINNPYFYFILDLKDELYCYIEDYDRRDIRVQANQWIEHSKYNIKSKLKYEN